MSRYATFVPPDLALLSCAATRGCSATPILGPYGSLTIKQGGFDVAVTPNGRYAFVANERGVAGTDASGANIAGKVCVVALGYHAATGVPTGGRPVG